MMEETIGQFQGMGEGDMQRMMKKMGGEGGGGLGDMMGGGKGPF
jgi:signal recognition particle subunit SRP54